MSKICIYGIIAHLSVFTFGFATSGEAQTKSVNEITVSIDLQTPVTLDVLIETIEKSTDFSFSHIKQEFNTSSYTVSLGAREYILGDLLRNIASQTDLSFHRVNEYIQIRKKEMGVDSVVEEIQINATVTGKVTDESGQPLPGATIIEKGTSNGTITDVDGSFSLNVNDQAVLLVSFVGYRKAEVEVGSESYLEIKLEPDYASLDEVVVVGYGTVEKSDVTGSISQVKTEELEAVPVYNVEQSLKARAPGVQVTQNSGQPGGRIQVRIRGGNSMIGSNDPLYVVDGFPMTGGINFLNPSDIESMDILKDASATAIYGARGANGVVIITTKKGSSADKGRIEIHSYYGQQEVRKRYDLLDAREYAIVANEWLKNAGQPPAFNVDTINGKGTDWQDQIFRRAPIQSHSISFSGGTDKTQYIVSGNYFDQDGIIINTGVKRGAVRLNLNHEVKEWLDLGLNLNVSRRQNKSIPVNNGGRGGGSVLAAAAAAPPTLPVYDGNGVPTQIENFYSFGSVDMRNPMIFASDQSSTLANSVLGNTSLQVHLSPSLSFKTLLGIEYQNALTDQYVPVIYPTDRGYAKQENSYSTSVLNENTLNYNKKTGVHQIGAVVGYTYQNYMSRYFGIGVSDFLNNISKNYNLAAGETVTAPWSGISEWVLASWLARVNYSFDDRYLVTLSVRSDGSSRFGDKNKWAAFPSAAISWRVSEEGFMKESEFFDDLKLRASYGITGNTALSPYQSLDRLETNRTVYANQQDVIGYSAASLSNGDLKWETTAQLDAGVDLGVVNNRIRITADYYRKVTSDLLASVPLPPSVGFGSNLQNVGKIENKGIELSLGADLIDGRNFSWSLMGTFTANRNKVLELASESDIIGNGQAAFWSGTNIARVGEPLGMLYGYVEDGLDENGHIKYVDSNKDSVITDLDKVIIGNPHPKFFYGLNSNLTYKGFELNVFFEGVHGNDIFNANNFDHLNSFSRGTNQFQDLVGNYWIAEKSDPNAKYPVVSSSSTFDISDRFIEDGSYVRLKSVKLAYNLPVSSWNQKAISSIQVYISGTNLLTFTQYSGLDPEVNSRGNNDGVVGSRLQMGYDQSSYPNAKNVIIGLKMGI